MSESVIVSVERGMVEELYSPFKPYDDCNRNRSNSGSQLSECERHQKQPEWRRAKDWQRRVLMRLTQLTVREQMAMHQKSTLDSNAATGVVAAEMQVPQMQVPVSIERAMGESDTISR